MEFTTRTETVNKLASFSNSVTNKPSFLPGIISRDVAKPMAGGESHTPSILQKTLKLVKYEWKVVDDEDGEQSGFSGGQGRKEMKQKYLIYLCDKVTACGGWGDRQRGFVNAYLIAYLTGRRFGINMTVPCDIRRFYVPNLVNWEVSEEEVRGRSTRYIHAVGKENQYSFHDNLTRIDFNEVYPEDVIYLRTNVEHYWALRQNPHYKKTFPPWLIHGRPRFFDDAWQWLMKPTPLLQDMAVSLLMDWGWFNRSKPLACAHIRIGVSKYNPEDSRKINDIKKLGALWEFLQPYAKNGSVIFMASDNLVVRETSREKFGSAHRDTGGIVVHVDKQRDEDNACEGFQFALLDQFILTLCDILITTNSNFSFRAVLIRANVKGLYFFGNGKIKRVYAI
ncbi:hypothetical protein V1264_005146 [Littorina saxatilis]|uniref:Uncharacterized protein n=1 Tax=Littorina saxatilis TaxID=31220 RepID=A0AAN9G6M2_9CAEN